jgi:L-alanine-DL-glutamate epimerase-like enolase superfamily enzyme
MRISSIEATPVAVPFRASEHWAFGSRRGMISILLHVHTDEGVTGIGEAAAYPSAEIVLAILRSVESLVLGESPFNIEKLMRRIHVVGTWHHVKATSPAMAAIEMACWDIAGKVCGQPLVNLFGGRVRDEVEYFYYVSQASPEAIAAEARRGRDRGFSTFYLKIGAGSPGADIARVEALRDGAGPGGLLRIDANEAFSPGTAIQIFRELERFGLELIEQPVSGRHLPEMAYVRSRLSTPILANEASWTRYDQFEVIRAGAADVISVDNQMDSGLLNMKRSAGLCEIAGIPVLKHSLGELGVAVYAATHLMASTPNFLPASQSYAALLSDDIIAGTGTLPYRNGRLAVPDGPGLGIELDQDRVAKYADLYRAEGAGFAFHDSEAIKAAYYPKR